MKKEVIFSFAILIPLVAFWTGCSNDFDVVDEWKNIPIVYGLLNENDTAQYIRVEKAFLDPEISALVIAQISDSLYYPDPSVKLVEQLPDGGTGSVISLQRVDANNEGYPKDVGIFANEPNWIYKTTENINATSSYKLELLTGENGLFVTGETEVIPEFDIFTPQEGSTIEFSPDEEKTNFVWEVVPDAKFFEVSMLINYREFPTGNPSQTVSRILEWKLATKVKPQGISGKVEIEGERFYSFMAANIEEVPGICRITGLITVHLDAGGEDLLKHIEVFEANQSGITGSEPIPEYTNLSEGFGIFSSRYRNTISNILLSAGTKEELANGLITGHLGFSSVDNPCN